MREPASPRSGMADDPEQQLWPVNAVILLLTLCGFGIVWQTSDFNTLTGWQAGWVRLAVLGGISVLLFATAALLRGKVLMRVQVALLLALCLHLLQGIGYWWVDVPRSKPQPKEAPQQVADRETITFPDYGQPPQSVQPEEQFFEAPIEVVPEINWEQTRPRQRTTELPEPQKSETSQETPEMVQPSAENREIAEISPPRRSNQVAGTTLSQQSFLHPDQSEQRSPSPDLNEEGSPTAPDSQSTQSLPRKTAKPQVQTRPIAETPASPEPAVTPQVPEITPPAEVAAPTKTEVSPPAVVRSQPEPVRSPELPTAPPAELARQPPSPRQIERTEAPPLVTTQTKPLTRRTIPAKLPVPESTTSTPVTAAPIPQVSLEKIPSPPANPVVAKQSPPQTLPRSKPQVARQTPPPLPLPKRESRPLPMDQPILPSRPSAPSIAAPSARTNPLAKAAPGSPTPQAILTPQEVPMADAPSLPVPSSQVTPAGIPTATPVPIARTSPKAPNIAQSPRHEIVPLPNIDPSPDAPTIEEPHRPQELTEIPEIDEEEDEEEKERLRRLLAERAAMLAQQMAEESLEADQPTILVTDPDLPSEATLYRPDQIPAEKQDAKNPSITPTAKPKETFPEEIEVAATPNQPKRKTPEDAREPEELPEELLADAPPLERKPAKVTDPEMPLVPEITLAQEEASEAKPESLTPTKVALKPNQTEQPTVKRQTPPLEEQPLPEVATTAEAKPNVPRRSENPEELPPSEAPELAMPRKKIDIASLPAGSSEVEDPGPIAPVEAEETASSGLTQAPGFQLSRKRPAGVPVQIATVEGPGGLGAPVELEVGLPSLQAKRNSDLIHLETAREILQKSFGRPVIPQQVEVTSVPTFVLRQPEYREQVVLQLGGTPESEEAVERGLDFFARHQMADGRWSLHNFGLGRPGYLRAGRGAIQSDSAATGLTLLTFLGAGYHHQSEKYRLVVRRGLNWLIRNQQANGNLFLDHGSRSAGTHFYTHGIATIALCEAYGMTRDPALREPARRALQYCINTRDPVEGGWRYYPNRETDTSVSGWMMMALKSGELAGFVIPQEAFDGLEKWLDFAKGTDGTPARYAYLPKPNALQDWHREPSLSMTAEGLLIRLYLGWKRDNPHLNEGVDWMLGNLPEKSAGSQTLQDTYYWYYATQVMYQMQGDPWQRWNDRLRPLLIETQETEGPLTGSWDPRYDRWGSRGGRIYVTAMHLLMLEVYYRHLPLFQFTSEED
ncbi:Hypothetical protein PBC10988_14050 [Planctomycetales bacterium 10988]|nr:Hypothetical protein PBC10988_14050 [Planctomycetales bacterium 10988]